MLTADISVARKLIPTFTASPVRPHAHLLASCAKLASHQGCKAPSDTGCCMPIPCDHYYTVTSCKLAKCQHMNGLCYSDPDPNKVIR